ncbi:hypothetical protein D3C80_1610650 [compost metagenome]
MQQHRLDPRGAQPGQLAQAARPSLLPGIEGELLDLRRPDRGMQVVMQTRALGLAEKGCGQMLEIAGAHGLDPGMLLVLAVEQAIDVLLDIALAAADRRRVAEQEEDPRARLQLATGNAAQQAVEQFDGSGFVAVDAGREQ